MVIFLPCRIAYGFEAIPDAGFADDQFLIRRDDLDLLPQLAHQDAKILNVAGYGLPQISPISC